MMARLLTPGSRAAGFARRQRLWDACTDHCTAYLAALDGTDDGGRVRLAAALGTLLAAHRTQDSDSVAAFDALLRAGNRAVAAGEEPELRLAVQLADTALGLRGKSRGAWRLRARALDALGLSRQAAEAYERCLALSPEPDPELTARLAVLREQQDVLAEAVALLPADSPGARAFAEAVAEDRSPERVRAAFTGCMGSALRERDAADPAVRRLAALYAAHCRLQERGRMPDPLLGGSGPLGIADFRNQLAGRSVCVVADGAFGGDTGPYDVVIRCDDYRGDRAGADGRRTDVHAVSTAGRACWDQQVRIRLVFGESGKQWHEAVRRLVPGAQRHAGDSSLRRPLSDPAVLGESGWGTAPSTAFTVLRLLDFLDVSPRIDLIGSSLPGPLRPAERDWVMARATSGTETRIALR
ncbi:hypothetical protein GCM10023083_30070 [Streptomyces phyllanthi]